VPIRVILDQPRPAAAPTPMSRRLPWLMMRCTPALGAGFLDTAHQSVAVDEDAGLAGAAHVCHGEGVADESGHGGFGRGDGERSTGPG